MVSPYTGNLSPLHTKGAAKSLRNFKFARKNPIWEHFVIHTKCVLIPTILLDDSKNHFVTFRKSHYLVKFLLFSHKFLFCWKKERKI